MSIILCSGDKVHFKILHFLLLLSITSRFAVTRRPFRSTLEALLREHAFLLPGEKDRCSIMELALIDFRAFSFTFKWLVTHFIAADLVESTTSFLGIRRSQRTAIRFLSSGKKKRDVKSIVRLKFTAAALLPENCPSD